MENQRLRSSSWCMPAELWPAGKSGHWKRRAEPLGLAVISWSLRVWKPAATSEDPSVYCRS
jgi:hypothetical protein